MNGRFVGTHTKLLWLVISLVIGWGNGPLVWGQNQPPGKKPVGPTERKIHTLVRNTMARFNAEGINRNNAGRLNVGQRFSSGLIKVDNQGRIQVYLELAELDAPRLAVLTSTGEIEVEIANENLKIVQGWVPYDRIQALAALDFVNRIRPPEYAIRRTGSKNSEGDAILKANQVRSTLGFTGAGVKVGVLSDGANNAASAQMTGDLPASITIFGNCAFPPCDEGTAMLEIIHDLAPGAILAVGAVNTSVEFIQRVTDLMNWGARIIVDDLGFYNQPYFEEGTTSTTVANAYSNAVAQGIVVVTAAGNDAQVHYQSLYVDSGVPDNPHNFGGGDITMAFTIAAGETGTVILQWSNRFDLSADDYDLCITTEDGFDFFDCSLEFQDGDDDPIEIAEYSCPGPSTCSVAAVVYRFLGAAQTLEMFILGGNPTEYIVAADSVFGHPAVAGVISVAAIGASNPGNLTIQPHSSRGPSTIVFPSSQQRATPTLTAIDCVMVTGAGGFTSPFCGTSAAAPHVAAIAALILQANPGLSRAQIMTALQNTAAERGTAGFDNTYGSGLADALAAVNSINNYVKRRRGQLISN